MTMVAELKFRQKHRQAGQSMIEFAFLIPIVIAMLTTLVQLEVAISSAIVNQKYARAQLHFLMFNHRYYPEDKFVRGQNGKFMRRFWLGVNSVSTLGAGAGGASITPVAPTRKIGVGVPPPTDGDAGDVTARQNVRIRITQFVCVPPVGEDVDSFYTAGGISEDTFAAGKYEYCSNGY